MTFEVSQNDTLLPFLLSRMNGKSRTSIKSMLAHGSITVNGCHVSRHDTQLYPGDTVAITRASLGRQLRHPLLRIVYEDNDLIVVDKHNGLLSVGTDKERTKTAFHILSNHIKRVNEHARLFVIHRLDRETSGLMLYAKNQNVQEILQRNWKNMILDRRYVALVEGQMPARKGTLKTFLSEDRNLKVWASLNDNGNGKAATTHYKLLAHNDKYSLIELSLDTGRKNQIRAQLEWLGTPVAGDRKYGAKTNPANRVCLHAYRLAFRHPVTGKELQFSTGIPKVFAQNAKNSGPQ